mmetsp:Transcript_54361/g.118964  ORF Transcript_54361/g.118964 Transcript_54361/m.118964 type:complete len:211 (-) Transcript_54361:125-757(-)
MLLSYCRRDSRRRACALLGVTPKASEAQIKKAFKKKALLCHPDIVVDEHRKVAATQDFLALEEAYSLLLGKNNSTPAAAAHHHAAHQSSGFRRHGGGQQRRRSKPREALYRWSCYLVVFVPVGCFFYAITLGRLGVWGGGFEESTIYGLGGWRCPRCGHVNDAGLGNCRGCFGPSLHALHGFGKSGGIQMTREILERQAVGPDIVWRPRS